jgi:TP901 family phage tail tape measure protein
MAKGPKIGITIDANTAGATAAVKRFSGTTQDSMQKVRRSTDAASTALKGLITGFVGLHTAVRAIQTIAKFETAMTEVSTLVNDSTISMEKLAKQARALGAEFGSSPTEQAKGFYMAISAGASTAEEATAIMTEANKLAVGGVTDVATAVDGLTSIVNAYGVEQKDVNKVTDAMFIAMKTGKTTIGELSQSIGRLAPTAKATGLSIDEMLAAVSAITTGGIRTDEAVIALNQALTTFVKKPSKDAVAAAAQLGIELDKSAITGGKFLQTLQKIEANATDKQIAAMFENVRSFKAILALTANEGSKFSQTLDEMANKAGAADDAVTKMMETLERQFGRVKASLEGLLVSVGMLDSMVDELKDIADMLEIVNRLSFKELVQDLPELHELLGALPEAIFKPFSAFVPTEYLVGDVIKDLTRKYLNLNNELAKTKKLQEQTFIGPALPAGYFPQPAAAPKAPKQTKPSEDAIEAAKKAAETQRKLDMESLARQQRIAEATAAVELYKREQHDETAGRIIENEQRIDDIRTEQAIKRLAESKEIAAASAASMKRWSAAIAMPFQTAFNAVLMGHKDFSDALVAAFKALISQLVSMLIMSGILSLVSILLGFLTGGASVAGTVGVGSVTSAGGVGVGAPVGMPAMMHDGGIIRAQHGLIIPNNGSNRDIVPALLRGGEEVLTPEDPRNAMNGGGGGDTIIIQTPMQLLAPPNRAEITRHFQSSVVPVLGNIEERKVKTSFERITKR